MEQPAKETAGKNVGDPPGFDIAVIGMAGRFPMADNLEEFWENLKNGKDCIGQVPGARRNDWAPFFGDRLNDFPELGYMKDISTFDNHFFDISPDEAILMDPTQRLLLETVYEAFEYGGYGGNKMAGSRTGVFIACSNSHYGDLVKWQSQTAEIGNLPVSAAGRIAYIFDLRGPALLIDTACSSALAALHFACRAINGNECSMAVVGAVNIYAMMEAKLLEVSMNTSQVVKKEQTITASNRCKVFDNSANGMAGGEGIGVLLLKSLPQALVDGDIICAVIKGTAMNQNGGRPPAIYSQNTESLAEVLRMAYEKSQVNPDSISYIEASGAANTLGDHFEIKSITDVFSAYTERKQFCPIGSVKANVGHLNHASGMASLMKVILAMNRQLIPPLVHFKEPNAYINFKDSPVYVETELKEWKTKEGVPLRAGISSFSVIGTNCHVIVEQSPPDQRLSSFQGNRFNILTVSAKSEVSLKKLCRSLQKTILDSSDQDIDRNIDDICFTQAAGRGRYEYRLAIVFKSKKKLIEHLNNIDFTAVNNAVGQEIFYQAGVKWVKDEETKAVFLFSDCSSILGETCKDFFDKGFIAQKYMEECTTLLPVEKFRGVLVFAFQYALARLWMDAGIKPAFVLGFGIGKYVSKVISGSMTLAGALNICSAEPSADIAFNKDKFIQNIDLMYAKKSRRIFLEIGPANILGKLTRQTLTPYSDYRVLDSYSLEDKEKTLLQAMALLYTAGVPIDFSLIFPGKKVVLPVYPFDGKSYWVEGHRLPVNIQPLPVETDSRPGKVVHSSIPYIPPGSTAEQALAAIFQDFFGIERVGLDDDFFKLGGDSLKAVALISRIHKVLNVKVPVTELFHKPTVKRLAGIIENLEKDNFAAIEPGEKKEYYSLSSAQMRVYIQQQMNLENTAYNMPEIIPLQAAMDFEKIKTTFKKMIKRHESLRTSFQMIDEIPAQVVHDEVEFEIEKLDGRGDPLWSTFIRPFDLSKAPLLRVGLIKNSDGSYLLLTDMHHIISDEVSHRILVNDFLSLYEGEDLLPLRIQYKDFSLWQNNEKETDRFKRQEDFWLKEFAGEIALLELPIDYPRPVEQSFAGDSINFRLTEEENRALKAMAISTESTLFMVLIAVYNILLARLSGREEIVIGTPIAGRRHADLENIIGMFVNTLSLRNFPVGEQTFGQFLEEVKAKTLMVFENQDYPFEELVDKLAVKRDLGRNPVFDTMFVLHDMKTGTRSIDREEEPQAVEQDVPAAHESIAQTAKFDLTLNAVEIDQGLLFSCEYCTTLFKSETIERFIVHFKKIVTAVVKNPGTVIGQIEIISDDEKQCILNKFNNTEAEYPRDKTLQRLFEEQALKTPDNIAVIGHGQTRTNTDNNVGANRHLRVCPNCLTYRQLNEQSDRVAGLLIEKGVQPGAIVAIMVDRSVELLIGIEGILKSGGAYLPIDPEYPQERIDYMLKDSNAKVLINKSEIRNPKLETNPNKTNSNDPNKNRNSEAALVLNFENLNLNSLKGFPRRGLSDFVLRASNLFSSNLAYVIYTSGSTGKPKGIAIDHHAVQNFINGMLRQIPFKEGKRILALTTVSFDIFGLETLLPLRCGMSVVMADNNAQKDMSLLEELILKSGIDMLQGTPTRMQMFGMRPGEKSSLRHLKELLVGGEAFPLPLLSRLQKLTPARIYNMYGPTETTIWSTMSELTGMEKITIGSPIINTQVFIMDKYFKHQPIGIPGEMVIGGEGLSNGYLNRPELTADRFLRNYRSYRSYKTYINYKTGDLARWLANGTIEFLGRIDQQVKIRGFRIELGEIEGRIANIEGIKDAAALALEESSGNKYLCAYFVSDREYGESELRKLLLKELPDYMIPSFFVQLERIPLTPNGKIDRKALPKPGIKIANSYTAPRTELESKLVEIWSEVLGIDPSSISIDANFFELGGHSLRATMMAAKILKELRFTYSISSLFKGPSIRQIAKLLQSQVKTSYESINQVEKKEYYPASSAQKRLYALHQMNEMSTRFNIRLAIPLGGDIDKRKINDVINRLVARHEALRTSFKTINNELVQRIFPAAELLAGCDYIFTVQTFNNREEMVNASGQADKPFDLHKPPLIRVTLIIIGQEERLLLVDIHHVIADGVSVEILKKEFSSLYTGKELVSLKLQYKDFSEWQNRLFQSGVIKNQEEYWLERFKSDIPVLNMPLDYPRPSLYTADGNFLHCTIKSELYREIMRLIPATGATLYMILLAAYMILLAKYARQEDIIVGSPNAGRRHPDLNNIIGLFVNMLPMRSRPQEGKTFRNFLAEVKKDALDAYENQDLQFDELARNLELKIEAGRNPLFDAVFVLQNTDTEGQRPVYEKKQPEPEEEISSDRAPRKIHHELLLRVEDIGGTLSLDLEYAVQLYRESTARKLLGHYVKILEQITGNIDIKLGDITLSYELIAAGYEAAPGETIDFRF